MYLGERRGGFTLLEVMVALSVLALVLVSALSTAAADLRASRTLTVNVELSLLAEELLARIELYPAARMSSLQQGEEGRFEPPMHEYRWFARSSLVVGEQGLFDVFVRIEDQSGGTLPLQTRLAQKWHDGETAN